MGPTFRGCCLNVKKMEWKRTSFGRPAYWLGCDVLFTVGLFYPGMTPNILIPEELHLALANTLSGGAPISLSLG